MKEEDTLFIASGAFIFLTGILLLVGAILGRPLSKKRTFYLKITKGQLEAKLDGWTVQKIDLQEVTSVMRGTNYLIFKAPKGKEVIINHKQIVNTDKREEFIAIINKRFLYPSNATSNET